MSNPPHAQAGGGVPFTQSRQDSVKAFSPAVRKYLEKLHHDLAAKYQWTTPEKDLSAFFHDVQKAPREEYNQRPAQDKDSFEQLLYYFSSPQASIVGPLLNNDLSYPLSNYFISTSHNTYLTGNQLSSHSSTEVYKNVLLRGCRSVEIDVWDGSEPDDDDGEHHGIRETLGLEGHKSNEEGHGWRSHLGLGHSKPKDREIPIEASPVPRMEEEELRLPEPWSAHKRQEPRVLHGKHLCTGHTLTKEVLFRDVCEAIRASAFVTSDLPVIVSLEIHTSLEQQQTMVDIMKQIWRGHLVHESSSSAQSPQLPAPGDLKGKILVKVKYTPPEAAKKRQVQDSKPKNARSSSVSSQSSDDEGHAKSSKPKKKKMLEALSDLGIYTRSYHFKEFDQPEAKIPTHVFSLSENTLVEAQETSAAALFKHNQDYLMRAYPKGLRVSSSNLNPPLFWRQGVQMAALNWQDLDKGIMLNEGMFAGTGGWALKPESYRSRASPAKSIAAQSSAGNHMSHDSAERSGNADTEIMDLDLEFFAAQNLPLPPGTHSTSFRPYVSCTLHAETLEQKKAQGHHLSPTPSHDRHHSQSRPDPSETKLKLRTRPAHGTDPDFLGEVVSFKGVVVDEQELCFLRLKVEDDVEMGRNTLAGWACVRLDRLREGIRTVRLFDGKGTLSDGMLLVGVTRVVRKEGFGRAGALPMR